MDRPIGKAVYEYVALLFGLGLLTTICLAWSLCAAILLLALPEGRGRSLGRRVIAAGFRLYLAILDRLGAIHCDLSALDTLRGERSLIIAPNHPGLLDAVMILSRLPDVGCVLKAGLMDHLLFGAGARLAGFIRNDAGHGMVKRSVRELERGSHLLLFPEGTRTTRPPVNPFKGSIALISSRSGTPVQTVIIEADSHFLGKHWPLLRRPDLPLRFRVRLGRRFPPPDDPRDFTARLERYFADELNAATLRPPAAAEDLIPPRHEHALRHPSGPDPQL